jgi:hypothetical protein
MTKTPKKDSSEASAAQEKASDDMKFLGALYENYPADFSSNYFSAAMVASSVRNMKAYGFTREKLLWGDYQKFAPMDPKNENNWQDPRLYQNWESAVAEAREGLAKIAGSVPGPDPDRPSDRARNMLEHLDTAVRIALFDKHLIGSPIDSGIEIEVDVKVQPRPSRRHEVTTQWHRTPGSPSDPKYKYNKLTIAMTCPLGGWIGPAVWKYTGPSRFTQYAATYNVPDIPRRNVNQIIFIFNGLESLPDIANIYPPGILQPVLQWTPDGNNWAIRSWYVPSTYTPSIDMMPGLNDERQFAGPASPAWTKATKVDPGKSLTGVVEWDGTSYRSSFQYDGATVATLVAPDILPLTYPVAVIEAYNFGNKQTLVDVTMNNIRLEVENSPGVPIEPTWEIGTDSNPTDGIHYGKGKLQKYKIDPDDNNATLIFKRK